MLQTQRTEMAMLYVENIGQENIIKYTTAKLVKHWTDFESYSAVKQSL